MFKFNECAKYPINSLVFSQFRHWHGCVTAKQMNRIRIKMKKKTLGLFYRINKQHICLRENATISKVSVNEHTSPITININ